MVAGISFLCFKQVQGMIISAKTYGQLTDLLHDVVSFVCVFADCLLGRETSSLLITST